MRWTSTPPGRLCQAIMASRLCLLLVPLAVFSVWCYAKLRSYRRIYADVPSPKRGFFFGSLVALDKFMVSGRHLDYGLERIYEELGEPECFYVDFKPFHFLPSMLVITSPFLAEQVTRSSSSFPYAMPKCWTMQDLIPLIGHNSIILSTGERWKSVRRQFQPGFQPQHLQTILPLIVREARVFASRLEKLAQTHEIFELRKLTQDLTVDIIGSVTLSQSFGAQTAPDGEGVKGPKGMFTAFKRVQQLFVDRGNLNFSILNPMRAVKLAYYQHILNTEMHKYLAKAIADPHPAGRSIASLAMKDRPLTIDTLQDAVDQLRSFVFAGFDTTSTVLQWVFYYLSLAHNQHYLNLLIEEHDQILGPAHDHGVVDAVLCKPPPMPITESVIKECLRLQPPAGTARQVPRNAAAAPRAGDPPTLRLVDGSLRALTAPTVLYIPHRILHNATKIWGPTAAHFNPLRFLDAAYMAGIPVGAYRPFERGPRACIGHDLAMMEAKVVLGVAARAFRFRRPVRGEVWSVYQVTAGPCDGMRMRVEMR